MLRLPTLSEYTPAMAVLTMYLMVVGMAAIVAYGVISA